MNAELQTIRQDIDALDAAIARLVQIRRAKSVKAQQVKRNEGLPAVDELRERQIKQAYECQSEGASAVAEAILTYCRQP